MVMRLPSDLRNKGIKFTLYRYQRLFKKKLSADSDRPKSFTNKIFSFIIAAHVQDIETLSAMTDKIKVRNYVASQIGVDYLNKISWVGEQVEDAPLQDYACGDWILKTNHGCGGHQPISHENLPEIRQKIKSILRINYYFAAAEPQYFFIKPKVFIEKLVKGSDKKRSLMFRLWCFMGSVALIQADDGSPISPFYNCNWQDMKISRIGGKPPEIQMEKPKNLKELIHIAEKLSEPFKFVRVDLYSQTEEIFFSELTFTPLAGNILFKPRFWDLKLGKLWQ